MISVIINGICGQMGHNVYAACQSRPEMFRVAAGVDVSACKEGFSCPVYGNVDEVTESGDVIIDFSVPAALPAVLRMAQRRKIPAVICTTGLTERDERLIDTAAERIPVFQTGNLSLGVNLQLELTKLAEATLGGEYDVEIIEKHHRKKIDAPSGTALMLADCVSAQVPGGLEYEYGRHEKNKRRTDREIGIHSVRGGTIVGEHQVMFIGNDEVVEITHQAFSKQVFARGALRAAQYLVGKPNGRYNMQNVVTEHDVASHLSTLDDQAVITINGLPTDSAAAEKVFSAIAGRGVSVDMISLSLPCDTWASIGFSLPAGKAADALDALRPVAESYPGACVRSHSGVVKLTVEGSGMALKHGVAARLMGVLGKAGINTQLITTSETKIECCVDTVEATKAVSVIQEGFSID